MRPTLPLPIRKTGESPLSPRLRSPVPFPSLFPSVFLSSFLSLSLSASFIPPHRHASGDTRGPTQVMHGPPYIFDPLFGLLFPTDSSIRCLPVPRSLISPLALLPRVSLSLRAVARSGRSRLSPSLFRFLLATLLRLSALSRSILSQTCVTRFEQTSFGAPLVTPVIVRLLLRYMFSI